MKNDSSSNLVAGPNRVCILDFGSQYNQLIVRRVRELGVYAELVPHTIPPEEITNRGYSAVILSGSPAGVNDKNSPRCDREIFDSGLPVLGICYGMQLMSHLLGGKVVKSDEREYGDSSLTPTKKNPLFDGLGNSPKVWMSHGDKVVQIPKGFESIASSPNSPIAAMVDKKRKLYGVQFHPEVVHTPEGREIIGNFLFKISGLTPDWTMSGYIEKVIGELRDQIGGDGVLCAVSGGVDSTVLAALLRQAIGDQLKCIFINNGLLRKEEHREVPRNFAEYVGIKLKYVNASTEFLKKLEGVASPERKRRIIGSTFIRVFEREAKKLGQFRFLAQGTLYPDVIESVSAFGGPSVTIKTHHNVGGLPARMKFELVEPFRWLFKDEVRKIGLELGLPEALVWRHPFPGPGLAVRIISPVTRPKLKMLRVADAIVREELRAAGLDREIWQAFAVLLPVKAVGVMGDQRTYANVIAVRAVTSMDGMTADWADIPRPVLAKMANRIINEVRGVNRVVYDVSTKPPGTIEWE